MKPLLLILLLLTLIINCSNLTDNERNKKVDFKEDYLPAQMSFKKKTEKSYSKEINVLYKKIIKENDEGFSIIACNQELPPIFFQKMLFINENSINTRLNCNSYSNKKENPYVQFSLPFESVKANGYNSILLEGEYDTNLNKINYDFTLSGINRGLIEGLNELNKYLKKLSLDGFSDKLSMTFNLAQQIHLLIEHKEVISEQLSNKYDSTVKDFTKMAENILENVKKELEKMFKELKKNLMDNKMMMKKNYNEKKKISFSLSSTETEGFIIKDNKKVKKINNEIKPDFESEYPKIKFFVVKRLLTKLIEKLPNLLTIDKIIFNNIYDYYTMIFNLGNPDFEEIKL
jgi:hypothetical protein